MNRIIKTSFRLLLALVTLGAVNLNAQQEHLSQTEVTEVVQKTASLMSDFYVIKEKGQAMSKALLDKLNRGNYNSLNGGELADILIKDLRSISNDFHLMMKFYPEGGASQYYEIEEDNVSRENRIERARENNYSIQQVSILSGNIGLLKLNGFSDSQNMEAIQALASSMNLLTHTNALIIDLRDNSGGDPDMVQFLMSYFFEGEAIHYNTFHFRDGKDNYIEKYTLPYVPGRKNATRPLYLLIGKKTFSAGEAFAYALKHLKRATIIGETSRGGAHGSEFKLINDRFDMSIPVARAINPITGSNWEGKGVAPDHEIDEEKAQNLAHMMAFEAVIDAVEDGPAKLAHEWNFLPLKSMLFPSNPSEELLKKYVGRYDEGRRVFLEKGQLKYQRDNGSISTLKAISTTDFTSDQFSDIRLRFDIYEGEVMGLLLYLENGQSVLSRKLE